MALSENSGMSYNMPVAPAGNYGGFGFGDSWSWIIILLLFGMFGGWGGGFGGGAWGMDGLYPWMNNSQNINDGFRDQMLATNVNGIQNAITSGFGDVQNSLCGGFAGVNASINGAQNALAQQLYTNQISDLERSFAAQTANTAGLTAIQTGLATEACSTRANSTANTQAILTAVNNGIQNIKDQLCSDKIEAKNDTIAQLRSELMYARGQASQDVQTAAIQAGQRALANEVEQYVLPTPRPAYMVSNPNCCYTGCGTNCGCGVA